MPEAMQRAIRSIKVRTVKDSGDGTTDQVVEVKLWGKARALKLPVIGASQLPRSLVRTVCGSLRKIA